MCCIILRFFEISLISHLDGVVEGIVDKLGQKQACPRYSNNQLVVYAVFCYLSLIYLARQIADPNSDVWS